MTDYTWLSDALSYLGVGAETAGDIAGIAGPGLVGAGVGALGGLIGGNTGLGALIGGATGALGGAANEAGLFGGSSTPAMAGTSNGTGGGGGIGGAAGAAAPAGVPLSAGGGGLGDFNISLTDPTSTGGIYTGGDTGGLNLGGPISGGGGGGLGDAVTAFGTPSGGTGAAGGAAAGTPAAGGGNSLMKAINDPSLSNILGAAKSNSNWLVPAIGYGASALAGNKQPQGLGALQSQADQLAAQGKQLQGYLTSGTLPPGVQSSIDAAGRAAKAAIRSRYAATGQSGSSAEQQDLAGVDQTLVTNGAQIATNLLSQGVNETGLAANLYNTIMQTNMKTDAALGSALSGFAGAMAGMSRPIVGYTGGVPVSG